MHGSLRRWLAIGGFVLGTVLGTLTPVRTYAQEFFAATGRMEIGRPVLSGTAGSVLFVGAGSVLAQDNANLFWDGANNRLGIGTASPGGILSVLRNGFEQFRVHDPVASATSYIVVSGGTTVSGSEPKITLDGSDNNVVLRLASKGNSAIKLLAGNEIEQLRIGANNAATRFLIVTGSTTNPVISTSAGSVLLTSTETSTGLAVNTNARIAVGTLSFPAGTNSLVFLDGTAPSSMGTNTAGLYADDVGGTVKMFAIDEAGNIQQLVTPQTITFSGFAFADIAVLASNGMMGYCTDCTIANPCAGGGTGAFAKRLNGVNVCN